MARLAFLMALVALVLSWAAYRRAGGELKDIVSDVDPRSVGVPPGKPGGWRAGRPRSSGGPDAGGRPAPPASRRGGRRQEPRAGGARRRGGPAQPGTFLPERQRGGAGALAGARLRAEPPGGAAPPGRIEGARQPRRGDLEDPGRGGGGKEGWALIRSSRRTPSWRRCAPASGPLSRRSAGGRSSRSTSCRCRPPRPGASRSMPPSARSPTATARPCRSPRWPPPSAVSTRRSGAGPSSTRRSRESPSLRAAWRDWQRRGQQPELPSSLPMVTLGTAHARSLAAELFVDERRTVLLPDPCRKEDQELFALRLGARPLLCPCTHGGHFDPAAISLHLTALPKGEPAVVLLEFPARRPATCR